MLIFNNKGLYEKARDGEIQHFTGVSDPYEIPTHLDLVLKTSLEPQTESLARILSFLAENGHISRSVPSQ